jgi:hypothetical protein
MSIYLHAKSLESRIGAVGFGSAPRTAHRAAGGRVEQRDEFGTGLRHRLEANGVPLIVALAGRTVPVADGWRG